MNEITDCQLASTSAMVVAQVMDDLNSMKNGTIRKRELKKALLTFNDEYQAEFDVDSIVQEVFKDNVTLDRSIIRREMKKNLDVQDSVTAEPIPDQIMRQLESIPNAIITFQDLNGAIEQVRKENGIFLTQAETSSMVESIFNSADDMHTGSVTRA